MSIKINIDSVYVLNESKSAVRCLDCLCRVKFRNSIMERILENKNQLQDMIIKSSMLSRTGSASARSRRKHAAALAETTGGGNDDDEAHEKLLARTNRFMIYYLGSEITSDDTLEIECFRMGKISKKCFGKYIMLLEVLRSNERPSLEIDDFLIDPKTNSTIPEKIKFVVQYVKPILEAKTGRVKDEEDVPDSNNFTRDFDISYDLRYLEQQNDMLIPDMFKPSNSQSNTIMLKNAIGRATISLAQMAFNPNMILTKKQNSDDQNSSGLSDDDLSSKRNNQDYQNQMITLDLVNQLLKGDKTSKVTSWLVKIQLLEIKHLMGTYRNIYCTVKIGDQLFKSSVKSVDKPRFNEVFTARIENCNSQKIFNKLISIYVYNKNFLRPDTAIGKFEIDFGTVYKHPTHEFYHKWGPVMPIEDYISSIGSSGGGFSKAALPKAHIKCDITIQAKGDKVQIHKDEQEKDDDIDSNLILPYGLEKSVNMIELVVNIQSAVVLLKYRINNYEKMKYQLNNLRKNLPWSASNPNNLNGSLNDDNGEDFDMDRTFIDMEKNEDENILMNKLNLFVRVTFLGATRQTACIKSTNTPIWNETFKFVYMFPGLIRLFKIELCSEDTFGTKVLASEYLDIESISEYKTEDYFFPMFGPSSIDLYSEPQNYRHIPNTYHDLIDNVLNTNFDISNYKSMDKILSKIVELKNKALRPTSYVPVNGYTPGGGDYVARLTMSIRSKTFRGGNYAVEKNSGEQERLKTKKLFTLFVLISDVYDIDARYQGDLSFQVCIGTHGYENLSKLDLSSKHIPSNFTQQQKPIRLGPKMPLYLAYDKSKPCLSLQFEMEDLTQYMYAKNFLLNSVKEMIILTNIYIRKFGSHCDDSKLHEHLLKCILTMQKYMNDFFIPDKNITALEKKRAEQLNNELRKIRDVVSLLPKTDPSFRRIRFNQIRDSIVQIKNCVNEPFSFFPDVTLWLLNDKQPVGICTIRSNDIFWCKREYDRGCICNSLVYTDLKTLSLKDHKNVAAENIARMRLYMWLGPNDESEAIYKNLKEGYGLSQAYFNSINLPTHIFYTERLTYELRCHIYQGRNLIGLDSTGLSDPFAKITLGNQSVYSKVIKQTNNPKWNTTLVIPEISLYSTYHDVVENPPEILVEIFDEDALGPNELMGKCYIKPLVQRSLQNPATLKWHKLHLGNEQAGDILASFELLQLPPNYMYVDKRIEVPIPKTIMPKMVQYTIEILFWGLRNMKISNSMFGRERLKICIQIGDTSFESNPIDKNFQNDNFLIIHRKEFIDLPVEVEYKPHLNIKCLVENGIGSKQRLVGSYTVKSINNFFKDASELKEKYSIYLTSNKYFTRKLNSVNYSEYNDNNTENEQSPNSDKLYNRGLSRNRRKAKSTNNNIDMDIEYLDWWCKYYASTRADTDDIAYDEQLELQTLEDNLKIEAYNNNVFESSDADYTDVDNPISDDESRKRRKKRLTRRKTIKRLSKNASIAKSKLSISQSKKLTQNIKEKIKPIADAKNENDPWPMDNIQKIQIYDVELEKVADFSDSFDLLDTYPLFKGKTQQINNTDLIQCYFKGKFLIYKEDDKENQCFEYSILKRHGGFLKLAPPNVPIAVKVRIYVVKAFVGSIRDNGICDPYLTLQIGDKIIEDYESRQSNTTEPIFGRMYEYDLKFPYESQVTISVRDYGTVSNRNLIGKTTIDLENRFYSDCYATCGIAKKYETDGYNRWRDVLTPTQILNKMLRKWRLPRPVYDDEENTLTIIPVLEKEKENPKTITFDLNDSGDESSSVKNISSKNENVFFNDSNKSSYPEKSRTMIRERLALKCLNEWQEVTGVQLVPEHVEARSLYNPESPELEQGKLEMWIDIFSLEDQKYQIPPAVDISPRKPKKFQLRVIIYNTEDVVLDDVNPLTGEKTSDIYMRGFLCDKVSEAQKTDTHYRSMNGEGKFNWRFIFDFDYLPAEEKVVYRKKEHAFSLQTIEYKMDPTLTLESYDADVLSADDFLGSVELNLAKMIRGADSARNCRLSMLKNKNRPTVNLFKEKNHRGWWPLGVLDGTRAATRLTGKVEAHFILLNEKQVEERPAGLGREAPDPLPEPDRPQESFLWFLAPLRTFKFVIWKNYKCLIIQIAAFILVVIFLLIFIFQLPSTVINKALSYIG